MSSFESLPIYLILLLIALSMIAANEIGFRLGKASRSRVADEASTALGSMVGGLLGMLGLVLAFTFSIAASQHSLRKEAVLEETNAIGTAYLRADLLEPQYADTIKQLLSEYVDVRLRGAQGDDLAGALQRSVEIHDLLWSQVSAAANHMPSTNTLLAIESVNDLIDMHTRRITVGLYTRIPTSIWTALIAISAFSMVTIGIQIGFAGKRRLVAVIPLSIAFAVLTSLVIDLDRPQSGLIKVGQQAMAELQKSIHSHTRQSVPIN